MTGGDKILSRIKSDCDERIKAFETESDRETALILADGKKKAEEAAAKIAEKSAVKAEHIKAAALSSAELEVRNSMLKTRRNEIDKTFASIYEYLKQLDTTEYFDVIFCLAKKLDCKNGVLMLNKKDLSRMPSDFNSRLQNCGVNAEICTTPADIDCGFILKHGDIEENMTFSSVLEDRRDEIEDLINHELFAK